MVLKWSCFWAAPVKAEALFRVLLEEMKCKAGPDGKKYVSCPNNHSTKLIVLFKQLISWSVDRLRNESLVRVVGARSNMRCQGVCILAYIQALRLVFSLLLQRSLLGRSTRPRRAACALVKAQISGSRGANTGTYSTFAVHFRSRKSRSTHD